MEIELYIVLFLVGLGLLLSLIRFRYFFQCDLNEEIFGKIVKKLILAHKINRLIRLCLIQKKTIYPRLIKNTFLAQAELQENNQINRALHFRNTFLQEHLAVQKTFTQNQIFTYISFALLLIGFVYPLIRVDLHNTILHSLLGMSFVGTCFLFLSQQKSEKILSRSLESFLSIYPEISKNL